MYFFLIPRIKIRFKGISFLIISLLLLQSCRDSQNAIPCFPSATIQVTISLNHPNYQTLRNVGGWVYVSEQQSGSSGLIVVKTTEGFRVYDRNPPHICPGNNTTLVVEDNSKLLCPADRAQWNLFSAEPVSGTSVYPKLYRYQYNSDNESLTLFN